MKRKQCSLFIVSLITTLATIAICGKYNNLNSLLLVLVILGLNFLIIIKFNRELIYGFLIFSTTIHADYPIVYHVSIPGGTRPVPEVWLVDIFLFLFFGSFIFQKTRNIKRNNPKKQKIIILYLIYLFWQICTLLFAEDKNSSLFHVIKEFRYICVFLAVYLYVGGDNKRILLTVKILFLSLLFQNTWGLCQWLKQSTFGLSFLGETSIDNIKTDMIECYTGTKYSFFGLKFGRFVSGLAGSGYLLARENLITLPIFLSMLINNKYIFSKKVHVIGVILGGSGIIWGFSKGAWVSTAIALSSLILLSYKFKKITKKTVFKLSSLTFVFLLIFKEIIFLRLFKTNLSQALDGRKVLNQFGFDLFIDNPLVGVGSNNIWRYFLNDWNVYTTVHNLYILLLSEVGVIGLVLFLMISFITMKETYVLAHNDRYCTGIPLGILCAMIGMHIDFLWTWLYRVTTIGSMYWAICGLAISHILIEKNNNNISVIANSFD